MKYNELILTKQKPATRSGRGISGGRGKTAGRGTKGQGARKSTPRPGFEGGQMPIYMRLPKLRGFTSHRRIAENAYTGQLDGIKKAKIDNQTLFEAGLVSSPNCSVKLLVKGDITSKKEVHLQVASKNAVVAIEKAGGSFVQTAQVARAAKKADKLDEK